jgi:hypothetical protein
MKKLGLLFLSAIVAMLIVGGHASAQNVGDRSYYFVTYFSNANTAAAPDATLRLVNDGDSATSQVNGHITNGSLYASIYTFDDSQQMQECCNCFISADGLLSESLNKNLMSNTLTGGREETSRGVIKIISGTNDDPTNNVLKAGLHGTMTHIQSSGQSYLITETPVSDANLASIEKQDLEMTCGFVMYLGSGQGVCTCTPEDHDF